jgi:outer membrane protein assembly factor BamB
LPKEPRNPLRDAYRWLTTDRRRVETALAVGILAIGGGVLLAYELLKRPPDVHNETATFKPQPPPKPKKTTVNWPLFGYNAARTRYLPAKGIKPPFRRIWRYGERPLLEFPPVYADGKLFGVNNNGTAFALDADTGKVLWQRSIGRLNASSPTYYKHRLYIVNLAPGHVVKIDADSGRVIWKRWLPGRAESSPLVLDDTLYFGCENDQLFALKTRNGHERWAATLGGPVKSAPAYYHGILYVGDYGGHMNAVNAKTGNLKWQSGSLGQGFGTSGEFYSTPAVAFGRVYAGNNDHRVYSYDLSDGTLAWTHSTGGYVYSGPTVARTRHSPPTVYIGSFDGNIYALDAKSGETRWSHSAGGSVIGSLSAVGEIVYVAEFNETSTNGYDMKTGRKVFHYRTGAYTPVISDGRRIYLTGYSSISALQPFKPKPKLKAKPGTKARARRAAGAAALGRQARKRGRRARRAGAAARRGSRGSSGSGRGSSRRSPGSRRASGNGGGGAPR